MNPEQRNDFLTLLGLGPRDCVDCEASFTPPPYHDCKDVEVCPACGYKRFEAFCETEEGQKQLKEAFDRLQTDCTHEWQSRRSGGDPANEYSYERITICKHCGSEKQDA